MVTGDDRIYPEFADTGGEPHRIVPRLEALTGLPITLPRRLRSAPNERFNDDALRVVHPPGEWPLEQAEGNNGLTFKLGARDGFVVAFAVPGEEARPLGAASLVAPRQSTSTSTRKPIR